MFGTVLENVVLDPVTRRVKFEDQSITENTRASYPLHYIRNHVAHGRGGHPKNIVFLTADAFGVLPPVAKLTRDQAMYYFLSGYTAKVAGTERGVTEPQATFSSCFGAVFLVWHPMKYAEMLGKLIDEHRSQVWLLNTGWTGGAYGVGKRMKLAHTRAMVHAMLRGELAKSECNVDPFFGLSIPCEIRDVPSDVLNPRATWSDAKAYDAQARKLAAMFVKNFEKFGGFASEAVKRAGPRL
jgi:phosphoenolpyruvate carboxykinase (ATP)